MIRICQPLSPLAFLHLLSRFTLPAVVLNMNGHIVQPQQVLIRDADSFLHRTVHDLFSLKRRTIVITGGARGIGRSFGSAVAEAGVNVALVDLLSEPHEHYYKLEKDYGVKVKLYKCIARYRLYPLLLTTRDRSDVTKYEALE